jgi:hypothetical protein
MRSSLLLALLLFVSSCFGAECTLYEKTHPTFLLDGAHLSTGKCNTCASCHVGGVFMGTPRTCIACHNGDPARMTIGRGPTHIPTSVVDCNTCHKTVAFNIGTTMNHTAVTTIQCRACHNGAYTSSNALGKPSNHIPEINLIGGATMDCNLCHKSTATWATVTMNHNNTPGNGAGWCIGCHLRGQTWLGAGERMNLNHRNKTPAPTDCSMSGCHRPLGNTGTAYRNWD